MGFVVTALRKPIMLLVAILAIVLVSIMAMAKMPIDIFHSLGAPVIYVSQPYGGLEPPQLEGHVATFYENQFLYVSGIKAIETKNIQGEALFKLSFYPGTDMASSMAEVIGTINRACRGLCHDCLLCAVTNAGSRDGHLVAGSSGASSRRGKIDFQIFADVSDFALFRTDGKIIETS